MLSHFANYGPHASVFMESHEAQLWPEGDEVAIGEDGVGFAEFMID